MLNLIRFAQNQAHQPGFWLFDQMVGKIRSLTVRQCALAAAFMLCLFLVGSCNSSSNSGFLNKFLGKDVDLATMSKGELMRYAYDLQNVAAEAPEKLSEFSAQDVELMLARADLAREDYPSVVWQYRSDACVLDVYFTAEDEQLLSTAKVTHFEIRERGLITRRSENPVAGWNCLQSIYHERQKVIEAGFRQIYAQNDQDTLEVAVK